MKTTTSHVPTRSSEPPTERTLLSLHQLTLAAVDMDAMVRFYDHVLGTNLRPFPAFGTTLWRGELAGVNLLLCPNEIAGVDARQSRHQLLIAVPDLRAAAGLATANGGSADSPQKSAGRTTLVVRDPDGNTIELIEG